LTVDSRALTSPPAADSEVVDTELSASLRFLFTAPAAVLTSRHNTHTSVNSLSDEFTNDFCLTLHKTGQFE